MAASAAELAVAYGQGARDAIMALVNMTYQDRTQILDQARADRDNDRFILCAAQKHWLVRLRDGAPPCPYCHWRDNA
jgi:hypothetical protein